MRAGGDVMRCTGGRSPIGAVAVLLWAVRCRERVLHVVLILGVVFTVYCHRSCCRQEKMPFAAAATGRSDDHHGHSNNRQQQQQLRSYASHRPTQAA